MVFFPRYLVKPHGFQKFHDILAAIVVGRAAVILTHEDNGHIGKELCQFMAGLYHSGGIHGDGLFHRNNSEGNSLLNNDCSVYGHGKHL